jgi:SAM-dependent methyltransferase
MAIYTATTFLSALLLFSIQPLFAKMVLPLLGGAPSVWAVALCFFQGALLAGYCYAHLVNRHVPERYAGFVHLAVTALAMASLPIGLPSGWREPPPGDPYLWQLGLFTVAVGLPFLAVAANAPLLQAWFARTGHPDGRDPYFLYAASNLGSFIALLAYPLVLEPAFGVSALSRFWTGGFVLLWAAIAVCFWVLRTSPTRLPDGALSEDAAAAAADTSPAPTWADRLGWIGLAMVPAALLTAYTTHIATDVASAPLIWVIPLSLYLLTFVLVFRDRPIVLVPCLIAAFAAGYGVVPGVLKALSLPDLFSSITFGVLAGLAAASALVWFWNRETPRQWLLWFHLGAVVLALLQLSQTRHDTWTISAATGVAAFFLSGLVAHRTLYEARPGARHLTQFYLFMSLGGVLGGLFSALIAPKLFSEVLEYPILLALTMACRPGALRVNRRDTDELLTLFVILTFGILLIWWSKLFDFEHHLRVLYVSMNDIGGYILPALASPIRWMVSYGMAAILATIFGMLVFGLLGRPAHQLIAVLLMCGAVIVLPSSVKRVDPGGDVQRSYFGVYRISTADNGQYNVLTHGTTLHGAQRIRDENGNLVLDTTPATYYYPKSPMAQTVSMVRDRLDAQGRKGRYGVIGLGTGSLACFAKEGEAWRFFEIDPVIIKIATTPETFSYVHFCQPQFDVVIGDARLTMAKQPPESYDLIIVDAFSSDAIPVHLLTADALRMYATKLKPDGVVLLHISNRYLDLDSVVSATAALVPELHGVLLSDDDADGSYAQSTSTVGVLSRSKEVADEFRKHPMALDLPATKLRGWTDDYSDILRPFSARLRW